MKLRLYVSYTLIICCPSILAALLPALPGTEGGLGKAFRDRLHYSTLNFDPVRLKQEEALNLYVWLGNELMNSIAWSPAASRQEFEKAPRERSQDLIEIAVYLNSLSSAFLARSGLLS